jgi:hypothetical protein
MSVVIYEVRLPTTQYSTVYCLPAHNTTTAPYHYTPTPTLYMGSMSVTSTPNLGTSKLVLVFSASSSSAWLRVANCNSSLPRLACTQNQSISRISAVFLRSLIARNAVFYRLLPSCSQHHHYDHHASSLRPSRLLTLHGVDVRHVNPELGHLEVGLGVQRVVVFVLHVVDDLAADVLLARHL